MQLTQHRVCCARQGPRRHDAGMSGAGLL